MKYKLANGQFIGAGRGFVWNDIQYPANWIDLASDEEKSAIGIVSIQEQPRPDDQYYFVTENNDGSFSTQPKQLEDGDEYVDDRGVTRRVQGLKSLSIEKVKMTANTLLATTDWMVIRKAERDVAIPDAVMTQRLGIVAEANRLEAAITACEDVESLIAVMNTQDW